MAEGLQPPTPASHMGTSFCAGCSTSDATPCDGLESMEGKGPEAQVLEPLPPMRETQTEALAWLLREPISRRLSPTPLTLSSK